MPIIFDDDDDDIAACISPSIRLGAVEYIAFCYNSSFLVSRAHHDHDHDHERDQDSRTRTDDDNDIYIGQGYRYALRGPRRLLPCIAGQPAGKQENYRGRRGMWRG